MFSISGVSLLKLYWQRRNQVKHDFSKKPVFLLFHESVKFLIVECAGRIVMVRVHYVIKYWETIITNKK